MTERKSTEIKIRVTPSEKARWQADSERQGVSLSLLICQNMSLATDLERVRLSPPSRETHVADYAEPVTYEALADVAQRASGTGTAWTQETHPAKSGMYSKLATPSKRRNDYCTHLKPHYAFCPTCDK